MLCGRCHARHVPGKQTDRSVESRVRTGVLVRCLLGHDAHSKYHPAINLVILLEKDETNTWNTGTQRDEARLKPECLESVGEKKRKIS